MTDVTDLGISLQRYRVGFMCQVKLFARKSLEFPFKLRIFEENSLQMISLALLQILLPQKVVDQDLAFVSHLHKSVVFALGNRRFLLVFSLHLFDARSQFRNGLLLQFQRKLGLSHSLELLVCFSFFAHQFFVLSAHLKGEISRKEKTYDEVVSAELALHLGSEFKLLSMLLRLDLRVLDDAMTFFLLRVDGTAMVVQGNGEQIDLVDILLSRRLGMDDGSSPSSSLCDC